MSEPKITVTSSDLDLELTALLGNKPSDFLVLCLDGVQFERFGTPRDTPQARESKQSLVDHLNDRSKDSWWPDLFKNWKREMIAQFKLAEDVTSEDFRPVVSFEIHRVCAGHSAYLHCAIRLFEEERVATLVSSWTVGMNMQAVAVIRSKLGNSYCEAPESPGENLSIVIGRAVKKLLIAEGGSKPETEEAK